MKAELRTVKTDAELALAESYASAKPNLPGDGKVVALRDAAFKRFEAQGLPHRRIEQWKYTDLRALLRDAKPLAGPPDAAAKERAKSVGGLDRRHGCAPAGVRRRRVRAGTVRSGQAGNRSQVRTLAQALAAGDPLVAAHLGKVVPADGESALALNAALMSDGAVIRVAAGATVERPIHLVFRRDRRQAGLDLHALAGGDRKGRPRHAGRKP